jgi:hypothetical protein
MKVSEFEAKLGTVSDDKLRQMLSASRATGPDVAVKLILAEGKRRGMGDLETSDLMAEMRAAGSATAAFPQEQAGYGGTDAPPDPAAPISAREPAVGESAAPEAASPAPPDWLNEETKPGLPAAVKALILAAAVGGILALAWKFSH